MHRLKKMVYLYFCSQKEEKLVAIPVYSSFEIVFTNSFQKISGFTSSDKSISSAERRSPVNTDSLPYSVHCSAAFYLEWL